MFRLLSRRSVDRVQKNPALPGYRPDIDGLRAIAILSVVLFHAFPSSLRGGFVGVDIFFVISGFLISGIIFKGLQRSDFGFVEFYVHRARRIFPALILVLAASYVFAWFFLLPDEYRSLGKHMAAGAGFVQNFLLWTESGYFDTASELKPLLHLWSLAVEEQFYLAFPLFFLLIGKFWKRGRLAVLATCALLSFALCVLASYVKPGANFYLLPTRAWELLLGATLALGAGRALGIVTREIRPQPQ